MSTALAIRERGERAVSVPTVAGGGIDYAGMMSFAEQLVTTGFLAKSIRTPAQAVAIILTGQELGLPPMYSLRNVHVIEGKPTLAGELQLALFNKARGRFEWRESTDERAVLWLRHPNGSEHVESFSMDDAKRAGITGKSNWKNYPKAMLRARCASAAIRAIAPDILMGLYDADELGAVTTETGEIIDTGAATMTRSAPVETRAPNSDGVTIPTTLDEAMAFPFPFGARKHDADFGQPMGEVATSKLLALVPWIMEKRKEKSDDTWHADTLAAIMLVLKDRSATETAAADEIAVDRGAVPAPGKLSDAIEKVDADPTSMHALGKTLQALLKSEGMPKPEAARIKAALLTAKNAHDMDVLITRANDALSADGAHNTMDSPSMKALDEDVPF